MFIQEGALHIVCMYLVHDLKFYMSFSWHRTNNNNNKHLTNNRDINLLGREAFDNTSFKEIGRGFW